jgi:hypothetical protein
MGHISCCLCRYESLESNIDTTKKNTTLNDASKKTGPAINTGKTKYMFVSCHQTAGQNHDMKIVNTFFENFIQFKYFRTTVNKCTN